MPHAEIRVRREPYYRLDATTQGMQRLGFEIVPRAHPAAGNVLVLWNRKAGRDDANGTASWNFPNFATLIGVPITWSVCALDSTTGAFTGAFTDPLRQNP